MKHTVEPLGQAFLEYLRNFTPQIVLLSLALVASYDSATKTFREFSGPLAVFVLACAFTAAIAMYLNIAQFLRKATSPSDDFLVERSAYYRERGANNFLAGIRSLWDVARERFTFFVFALFAILVVSITPWVVLILSLFSANSIFRTLH